MNNFKEIINEIKGADNIVISSHVNPDGDAIGGGLSLMLAIKKLEDNAQLDSNKKVRFILEESVPKNLRFLKYNNMVEVYDPSKKYDFDLFIAVDCATKERLGKINELLTPEKKIVNIDHHTSNSFFGHLNYVQEISSTSEIMFNFIEEFEINMDVDMAETIYTGIVNDTGNFAHDNVSADTFKIAAKLKNLGVDTSKVVREFFQTKSMPTLKLMGLTLNGFNFVDEKKLSYFFLTQKALKSVGGTKEETEGLVEILRSYEGTEVALFLREEENGTIKGSLRSKSADVNKIASIFGGGGHVKAAGFNTDIGHEEIIKQVLKQL